MNLFVLLETFSRIAETGSITAAARSLRISVPLASRQLRALEQHYGVSLVRRTTRRLALTEAGTQLVPKARALLRDVEDTAALFDDDQRARGRLVISAPVTFSLSHVSPHLPRLLRENPALQVELQLDDRVIELLSEGVDLALRVGSAPPDSTSLIARRLASYERVLVATASLARQVGADPGRLSRTPCLLLGAQRSWHLTTPSGALSLEVDGPLRSNNVQTLREAALAGLGVAQLPAWLVREDLQRRRLTRVLAAVTLPTVPVYALSHAESRRSRAVKVALEFFARALPRSLETPPTS